MFITLTLAFNFITVYFLYTHWRNKEDNKRTVKISWGLIVISLIPWLINSGPEFGIIYWGCCSTISSWIIIFYNRKSHQNADRKSNNNDVFLDTKRPYIFSLKLIFKRASTHTLAIIKLLFVIIIPFIFSASICFILPLISQNYSSNMLMLSLTLFLIIWPLSLLECHKFINQPKRLMIFSSLSLCMLLSVVGTKLV